MEFLVNPRPCIFSIDDDLGAHRVRESEVEIDHTLGSIILFRPKEWARGQEFAALEEYRLSPEVLASFGRMASKIRTGLLERALALEQEAPDMNVGGRSREERLAKRLYRTSVPRSNPAGKPSS